MEIRIDRKYKKDTYTISNVYVDGKRFGDGTHYCSCLEDRDRGLRQDMDISVIRYMKTQKMKVENLKLKLIGKVVTDLN